MRQTIRVAVATDDGQAMRRAHFGSAPRFAIYELPEGGEVRRLAAIDNPFAGEGHHHFGEHSGRGGPGLDHDHDHDHGGRGHGGHGLHPGRRAQRIMALLAEHDVDVVVSQAFGRNIMKIKAQVLPVLVKTEDADAALAVVAAHRAEIDLQLAAGSERRHLVLKS